MWMCAECGFVFHEPDYSRWVEPSGEPWVAKLCPDCGSDEIGEVNEYADEEFC